jgi:hypothetical protein
MPLRIAFDLDGVLADMESELVRQAAELFGDGVMRHAASAPRPEGPSTAAEAGTPRSHTEAPAAQRPDSGAGSSVSATGSPGSTAEVLELEATPPALKRRMTMRQERRLWRHVESIENFWETLQECEPGVVARLSQLATDRRWEVIFLTKRPPTTGRTAQVQTQRWLESKGFLLPSVFVVQGSRGRIAASLNLSIVVDDRCENCLDIVLDSKARAVLVWREADHLLPAAVRRAGIRTVRSCGEALDLLDRLDPATEPDRRVVARVRRLFGLKKDPLTA